MSTVLAWHFVGKRLRDGRPVPKDGVWLEHQEPLVLCESGLHASVDPWDAVRYAPGPILCRVEMGGAILHGTDKMVATRRRIVARIDATDLLRYFARMRALSVIDWYPDPPDVVLNWLMTGNESLRSAAWSAAQSAARAASV